MNSRLRRGGAILRLLVDFCKKCDLIPKPMPTSITQLDDSERNKIVLRIEGDLKLDDALLLERIALDLREENERNITLDFADLDLLDSESAPVLIRLERHHGFEIEGLQFFLQKMVEEAEGRAGYRS